MCQHTSVQGVYGLNQNNNNNNNKKHLCSAKSIKNATRSEVLYNMKNELMIVLICIVFVSQAVGLLYWILLAAARGYAVGFPLFVGISCWMLTIGFFAIFVLSLDKRVTVINWLLTVSMTSGLALKAFCERQWTPLVITQNNYCQRTLLGDE